MKRDYGLFPGGIPFLRCGADPAPLVVVNGGQAFMRRPSQERFEREAGRIGRILPVGQSFLLLGYGGEPPQELKLDDVVEILATALRSLPNSVRLAGISYGGIVAVRLAARYPDIVSDLILIASAHSFSEEGACRLRRQIDYASQGRYSDLVQEFGGVFRRRWLNWLLKLRIILRRGDLEQEMNDPEHIRAYLGAALGADGRDGTAWLGRVRARTLVIGGSRDQFFGGGRMRETAQGIPGGRLHLLPGETHMAPVERAAVFRERIADFLGQSTGELGQISAGRPKDERIHA